LSDVEFFWATLEVFERHREFIGDTKTFWATEKVSVSPIMILGDVEAFCVAQKVNEQRKKPLCRPKSSWAA
jgi:hypothetical protein